MVVDGDDVFVRSVQGDRGRWFQAVLDSPEDIVLHVGEVSIPVRAVRAADDESITRCSTALQAKYGRSGASLLSMLRSNTLETTLRLEPR